MKGFGHFLVSVTNGLLLLGPVTSNCTTVTLFEFIESDRMGFCVERKKVWERRIEEFNTVL